VTAVFRLFANCIPVKGARRSLLCDLQTGRLKLIPNSMFDMLASCRQHTAEGIKQAYDHVYDDVIDEYLEFLIDQGWGFWCENPEAFPEMPLDYHCPDLVTNALIDADADSDHDYADLFNQLQDLGCKHVELRFFAPLPLARLAGILDLTTGSRLRGIALLLPFTAECGEAEMTALCRRHPRIARLTLTGAPGFRSLTTATHSKTMGVLIYHPHVVDGHHHCGVVDRMYFAANVPAFTEALHHNSCLNRKISVDCRGVIRNCPSMTGAYGNAREHRLAEALEQPGFRDVWSITKDQVAVCRDCEFRYVCSDCRAYVEENDPVGKPARCDYDPYTATWGSKPINPFVV